MICARCDKPIKRGERSVTRVIEQGSGGATIRIHASCQPDAATQPRRYPRQQ